MPTVKWCGNKAWDADFPEKPLPEGAKRIKRPDNIFKCSLPYGIVPLLFCYGAIILKWFVLEDRAVNPLLMPVGILVGLLMIPVHELLHAACYKTGQKVYVGISLGKFAAFAVCHEPISKKRFIVMSLMPMALGLIPLAIFVLFPPSSILSGVCVPAGIIGMLSPMPDYLDVHLVLKQTPKGATIQSQNTGFYWYL